MKLAHSKTRALLQVGFFKGVVLPIYEELSSIFPGAGLVLEQAKKNSAHWEAARAAADAAAA
jgi:hypothetical protein